MKHLICLLFLAGAIPACATRTPPPEAQGRFKPVNGEEQAGMPTPAQARRVCPPHDKPAVCRD